MKYLFNKQTAMSPEKWNKSKKVLMIFGITMILLFLLLNVGVTWINYFNFIDSDDASELILSKMLAEDGGIMSSNWYYSTEIRVLNTQLVYMLLFHLFSDFRMVRVFGQIILSVILLVSYYFLLRSIEPEKANRRFYMTAFLLLIPMSEAWTFLNMKSYYVPHIAISFMAFGFAWRIRYQRKRLLNFALGIMLGFTAGLGGIRSLQLTYIPLGIFLCVDLWKYLEYQGWNRLFFNKDFWISWIENMGCAVASLAGFLMNTFVLSSKYNFKSYSEMKYRYFSAETLFDVWNDLVEAVGYVAETYIFSLDGICNTFALILISVLLMECAKKTNIYLKRQINYSDMQEYQETGGGICDLSFVSVLVLFFNLFVFIVTKYVTSRYIMACLPLMILFVFTLEKKPKNKQIFFYIALCFICIFLGVREYKNILFLDGNEAKRGVIDFIEEKGYSIGIATFWNGNVITELTDGKIQFANIGYDEETGEAFRYDWLCPMDIYEKEGTALLILTKEEEEQMVLPEKEQMAEVYEDENYIAYEVAFLGELDFLK